MAPAWAGPWPQENVVGRRRGENTIVSPDKVIMITSYKVAHGILRTLVW